MNTAVRLVLYVIFLVAAILFGIQAKQSLPSATVNTRDAVLDAAAATGEETPQTPIEDSDEPPPSGAEEPTGEAEVDSASSESTSEQRGKLFRNGFFFVLSVIGVGILAAMDLSSFFGQKAVDLLYNDDAPPLKSEMYEEGETLWNKGDYLGAIETFRQYYKKHPHEVHALRRIAEIYEGDLKNYVAAAMEYESILQLKLPSHRWAWTALHLHNLYVKHLDRKDDAIELLKRVVTDHPDTPGGEKAAQRLRSLGYQIEIVDETETDESPDEPEGNLPKGFRPKE